ITSQLSMALHDQLRASRLDFAILHNPPSSPALAVTSLGAQDLYLVGCHALGKSAGTVPLKALHDLPLVMPSAPHATRKPLELEAGRLGITLNVFLEVDQIESLFQLVSDGVAHTVATGIAAQTIVSRRKLVFQRIVSPKLSSELSLVTPAQRNLTPLQSAAASLAVETFNDLLAHRQR
ncbi:MAG: LysR family transcriptional regulator, partial [Polaromonas sp.]|nr:LysR family transcriptional regulator [Polaromonas sp.]